MSANDGRPERDLVVRLVSVVVQLNLVVDDGSELDPLQVQPIHVAAKDWPKWEITHVVAQAQAQVEGQANL